MFKKIFFIALLSLNLLATPLLAATTPANNLLANLLQGQDEFLPVDQAFVMDYRQQDNELIISWSIADGYYMYRDKFKLGGIGVSFSHPSYPASMQIEDEFFGVTQVYFHQLILRIPLNDIDEDAIFRVQYMGCAEAGLCYPPTTKEIPLQQVAAGSFNDSADATDAQNAAPVSSQIGLTARLSEGSTLATLGLFFLLGLGLAFTPCVFPMYPILSSIIVGQGKALSSKRAFGLSFSYVQGMALTYSALGLVVASLGVKFQAWMQHPAVLIVASVLFVVLALAMFGGFNFQLPSRWQAKVAAISNKQQGGSLKGAFVMGALSGLIASPCTTAPLSAALLYVAQSGDLLHGALTLYILSLGMGLPLILLGTSGGKLLPKAGQWMYAIKTIFGFLLLAVPLILLERMLDFWIILLLGSLLTLALVFYLYRLLFQLQSINAKASVALSAQLLLLSVLWLNIDYWRPAATSSTSVVVADNVNALGFIEVSSTEELTTQLQLAAQAGQFAMLDLYADWCVACKEFEQKTFPHPEVQVLTSQMRLIKYDVTRMSRQHQALLDKYQVLGLPTLLFFAPDGSELTQSRVTGFMNAAPFAGHLQQLLRQPAE
ncbi:protein-disulfide reductase DsbD [Arsukibacterium sp.]|uniref:protein-disulfide reductase DsbD n=1 Tax=Arsukibacterium sp. TaxID=1977258 RepID=UPI002FD882B1